MALQAPLFMEFSRQEYWSGLPFPSSRDLTDPRIEATSPVSPTLAGSFFTTENMWSPTKGKTLGLKSSVSPHNNVSHVIGALEYLFNEFTAIRINSTKL